MLGRNGLRGEGAQQRPQRIVLSTLRLIRLWYYCKSDELGDDLGNQGHQASLHNCLNTTNFVQY